MRNAIEHPGGKQGRLHILNFELIKEDARGRFFQGPVWFLEGEKPAAIAVDLQTMFVQSSDVLRERSYWLLHTYS